MEAISVSLPDLVSRFRRAAVLAAAVLWGSLQVTAAHSADVVVRVTGIAVPLGQIGCSLFKDDKGFPMDHSAASVQWQPASGSGVTCRFTQVAVGRYAVSAAHDSNDNRRVDTNFLGIPTEQWGVSGNVRPRLRAPTFDEAVFTVAADSGEMVIDIKVAK